MLQTSAVSSTLADISRWTSSLLRPQSSDGSPEAAIPSIPGPGALFPAVKRILKAAQVVYSGEQSSSFHGPGRVKASSNGTQVICAQFNGPEHRLSVVHRSIDGRSGAHHFGGPD
jgi:hypothetical protein